MKLKVRIVSTVLSMALALGVMGFAVYAAATQTLVVTNTVNFVSDHVLATVNGYVNGATNYTVFGDARTTNTGTSTTQLGLWAIGDDMQFAEETAPIEIILTIKNNSEERFFTFELNQTAYDSFNGDPLEDTNINRNVKYYVGAEVNLTPVLVYADEAVIQVPATETATIVITLQIADTGKSVLAFDNSFSVTLLNNGVAGGGDEGGDEVFVFEPTLKTVTIPANQEITLETLPEMSAVGDPAFYGLYTSQNYLLEEKIELPYTPTQEETLYAKLGELPEYIYVSEYEPDSGKTGLYIGAYTKTPGNQYNGGYLTGHVELPDVYEGQVITSIPSYGFSNNWFVTSIKLPSGLTEINQSGLADLRDITTLTIPDSVTFIDYSAFYDCYDLLTINFPENISFIGSGAFDNTLWLPNQPNGIIQIGNIAYLYQGTAIGSVALEAGTKSIADKAFFNQASLTGVTNFSEVTYIDFESFANTGLTTITIPGTVDTIADQAFTNSALTEVIMLNGVRSLGTAAFRSCLSLTSVTIPDSVSVIKTDVFDDTPFLGGMVGEDYVYNLPTTNYVMYAGKVAYMAHPDMPTDYELTLLSKTKGIADNAFNATNAQIASVEIPLGVSYIGAGSFMDQIGITNITIPSSITEIEMNAFAGCLNLSTVNIESDSFINYISQVESGDPYFGALFSYATDVYVLTGLELPSPLFNEVYVEQSEDYYEDYENEMPDGLCDGYINRNWDEELQKEVFEFLPFVDELMPDGLGGYTAGSDGYSDPVWDGTAWDETNAGYEDRYSFIQIEEFFGYRYNYFEPVEIIEGYTYWVRSENNPLEGGGTGGEGGE